MEVLKEKEKVTVKDVTHLDTDEDEEEKGEEEKQNKTTSTAQIQAEYYANMPGLINDNKTGTDEDDDEEESSSKGEKKSKNSRNRRKKQKQRAKKKADIEAAVRKEAQEQLKQFIHHPKLFNPNITHAQWVALANSNPDNPDIDWEDLRMSIIYTADFDTKTFKPNWVRVSHLLESNPEKWTLQDILYWDQRLKECFIDIEIHTALSYLCREMARRKLNKKLQVDNDTKEEKQEKLTVQQTLEGQKNKKTLLMESAKATEASLEKLIDWNQRAQFHDNVANKLVNSCTQSQWHKENQKRCGMALTSPIDLALAIEQYGCLRRLGLVTLKRFLTHDPMGFFVEVHFATNRKDIVSTLFFRVVSQRVPEYFRSKLDPGQPISTTKIPELFQKRREVDFLSCACCRFLNPTKSCKCQDEFYCSKECQVDHWDAHYDVCKAAPKKPVETAVEAVTNSSSSASSSSTSESSPVTLSQLMHELKVNQPALVDTTPIIDEEEEVTV